MITEDKQFKTYRAWGIVFAIFVTGAIIGAWSDKYFFHVLGFALLIQLYFLIKIIWRGWKR